MAKGKEVPGPVEGRRVRTEGTAGKRSAVSRRDAGNGRSPAVSELRKGTRFRLSWSLLKYLILSSCWDGVLFRGERESKL